METATICESSEVLQMQSETRNQKTQTNEDRTKTTCVNGITVNLYRIRNTVYGCNYDVEPWSEVKHLQQLHECLRTIGQEDIIPQEYQ